MLKLKIGGIAKLSNKGISCKNYITLIVYISFSLLVLMPDTDVLAGLVLQQLTAVRCGEDEGAVQGRLLHSLHQPQLPPA